MRNAAVLLCLMLSSCTFFGVQPARSADDILKDRQCKSEAGCSQKTGSSDN